MQTAVTADLVIPVCFCFCLSQPIASASLCPSGTWVLLWRDGDTAGRNAHIAWSIPAALMPIAENLGATRSIHRSLTCRSARSCFRGHKTPCAFPLLWDWRECISGYSSPFCGLLGKSQWRNTLPPKSARNVHSSG